MSADVRVPDYPGHELAGLPGPVGRGAVERVTDAVELSFQVLAVPGVDALDDRGRFRAAEAAERLDHARATPVAGRGVGQDDAAGLVGEQRRVGERGVPAEAAAEDDRLAQPERVAQPPQVIGPGSHVPELGAAAVAAAVAPQVEVQDLEVAGQRAQRGFHRHVVQAGAAVDGHQNRAFHRRVSLRDNGRPGDIEPQGHITKADAHAASSMLMRIGERQLPYGQVLSPMDIEVVAFDVFGTLVDWHTSVAGALAEVGSRAGIEADWPEVANAWRALYHPTLDRVGSGGGPVAPPAGGGFPPPRGGGGAGGALPFQPLDVLHRMMLDQVATECGLG